MRYSESIYNRTVGGIEVINFRNADDYDYHLYFGTYKKAQSKSFASQKESMKPSSPFQLQSHIMTKLEV